MDWFLYGKGLHDERIKIRNEQLLKNFEKTWATFAQLQLFILNIFIMSW